MSSLKIYLLNLNIFEPSDDLTTDEEKEHERRSQLISTRIFFLFLFIVLIIIAIIIRIQTKTMMIIVEHPTEEQYKNLSSNVHCPCSRSSVSYGEFTTIEIQFHQVCSSDFISDRWIKTIYSGSNATYFYLNDFRVDGSAAFQALSGFCQISKNYILQSIDSFNQDLFFSSEVVNEFLLQVQINSIIQTLQLSAMNELSAQLELVQAMIIGNHLHSALLTNIGLIYIEYFDNDYTLYSIDRYFAISNEDDCHCSIDMNCHVKSRLINIFGEFNQETVPSYTQILMTIPGFRHGCLPTSTILLSTLECFYNQTCLNELLSFFPTNENFTALAEMEQSRFQFNSTIKSIVNELMIEQLDLIIAYDKYYQRCAPISCSYFERKKYDLIFILTKLIGLLGTLTMVLRIVIENVVKFIRRPRNNSNNITSEPCKSIGKNLLDNHHRRNFDLF